VKASLKKRKHGNMVQKYSGVATVTLSDQVKYIKGCLKRNIRRVIWSKCTIITLNVPILFNGYCQE